MSEKEVTLERLAVEYAEFIREAEACSAVSAQAKVTLDRAYVRTDETWVKVAQAKKRLLHKAEHEKS